MQRDPSFFNWKVAPPNGYGAETKVTKHDCLHKPLNRFAFEPTETCPKNFIIFDHSVEKSWVMFHPTLVDKFNYHGDVTETVEKNNDEDNTQFSYPFKEDTKDIDALLSSDEDSEDDDEVSTGRTPTYWESSSPDSLQSSDSSSSESSETQKKRLRKMVKVLKGIVPGGEVMDTPAIIDEAVRYLKSLKVEVKKLGIQNFEI